MSDQTSEQAPAPPPREPSPRRLGLPDDAWKTVAAVMIGIATLTGAWLTLTSVRLADEAGGADVRSTVETVAIEQERADAAVRASAEMAAVAQYRAMLAEADVVEQLPAPGLDAGAREDEARVRRALAENFKFVSFDPAFLQGEGAQATYDVDGRIDAMLRQNQTVAQMDPDATAAAAKRDHDRSVRLVGWVVALVAVVGLLSLAELAEERTRPPLVIIAIVAYVVITTLAVVGNRSVA